MKDRCMPNADRDDKALGVSLEQQQPSIQECKHAQSSSELAPDHSISQKSAISDGNQAAESVSARQAKKQAKKEQLEAAWAAKKVARKAAQKQAKAEARAAKQAEWDALSPEEQEIRKQEAAEMRAKREEERKATAAAAAAAPSMPTCAIDLSFEQLMADAEITSLAQQLMYSYGANRRARLPLQLAFCSLGGKTEQQLTKINGFGNWKVARHSESYLHAFDRSRLVYLSSESDEALHSLDPDAVYVIGGLVDHNKHKGLTHARAVAEGLRTVRLPIDEHMQMSQRRVLAVNHVFEIMLHFANSGDWKAAFLQALPQRRGAQARSARDEDRGVSAS
uniref:tRNA (guanine(9)-N(1))-methyltransferase n=1 Tax=Chrysotila carterae TaxID=13221 RepID=A0A7S4EYN7_CHRCT